MKNIRMMILVGIPIIMAFSFMSCEDWVTEVDPLSSQVEDGSLDSEEYLDFLLKGVLGNMGRSEEFSGLSHIIWRVAGFSDEFVHGKISLANYFVLIKY